MRIQAVVTGAVIAAAVTVTSASADQNIRSAIVNIYVTSNSADFSQPWRMEGQEEFTGSGVIVTGNRILTNAHVVSDQTFMQVRRAGQSRKYKARLVAVSHVLELALLEVKDESLFEGATALELGALPKPGDAVNAYGFPKGGTRITVTEGVVSRIDLSVYSHTLFTNMICQIDAAINEGSSGGPVVSNGKVVGIAFQSAEEGENIGYMIPAPLVDHFLDDLSDGTLDGVPDIALSWQNLENPQYREFVGMTEDQSGVLITQVAPRFSLV